MTVAVPLSKPPLLACGSNIAGQEKFKLPALPLFKFMETVSSKTDIICYFNHINPNPANAFEDCSFVLLSD